MTQQLASENSLSNKLELPLPPDLLRRFVECANPGTWCIAGVMFDVETNSAELLHAFPSEPGPVMRASVRLKIVVDDDLDPREYGAPFIIDAGQLCWGNVHGLLFAFDRAIGELLMFVPKAHLEEFKPTFEELLHSAEPILAEETCGARKY